MLISIISLQMTVMLMKLIEDVLALFRALCPCLFHNRQLFESLTNYNKRKTGFNSAVGDPVVFIYPNKLRKDRGSSAASVYVKDPRTGRKKRVRIPFTYPLDVGEGILFSCNCCNFPHISTYSCSTNWLTVSNLVQLQKYLPKPCHMSIANCVNAFFIICTHTPQCFDVALLKISLPVP